MFKQERFGLTADARSCSACSARKAEVVPIFSPLYADLRLEILVHDLHPLDIGDRFHFYHRYGAVILDVVRLIRYFAQAGCTFLVPKKCISVLGRPRCKMMVAKLLWGEPVLAEIQEHGRFLVLLQFRKIKTRWQYNKGYHGCTFGLSVLP